MTPRIEESWPKVLVSFADRNVHLLHLCLQLFDEKTLIVTVHNLFVVGNDGADKLLSDLVE